LQIAKHALSSENIDLFLNEIKHLVRHQHPHIVQILDSGQQDGRPYFTMTYSCGFDLVHIIKDNGSLNPTTAAFYVSQIAWAIHYFHTQSDRLVHEDLKPTNILLDHHVEGNFPHGLPYLADFGFVELLRKVSVGVYREDVVGTPAYMSPEQAEGQTNVDPLSDVWRLGVILFEYVTRSPPFQGETRAEILYQIINREAPSPRAIQLDIPHDLQRICPKCLKKKAKGSLSFRFGTN
jgi:serine/threonine-protein kinase